MTTNAPISLFTSKEEWTERGHNIALELDEVLRPLLLLHIQQGVRIRDLEYIAQSVVTEIGLAELIIRKEQR